VSGLGLALTVLAVFVLPGLAGGVGLTLLAGRSGVQLRGGVLLSRVLASGLAAWLLTAGLLVRTVGISGASAVVAGAVLTVGSLGVLLLPASRSVVRQARADASYAAAAAGLALLAWAPLGLLVWGATSVGTFASTPWYYWGLARQILETGHFPETSVEFARSEPFLADYPLFSSATALVLAPLPESAQPAAIAAVVTLGVVLLACAAALLARALGSSSTASLVAAPLAVTLGIGAFRLLGYRPEGFALAPSVLVAVLVLDWFRHRERSSLVLGCVLGAVVSQIHGIAFLAMVVLLVAVTVALLVEGPRRGAFLRTAVVTAVLLVVAFAVLALAMGRFSGSGTSGGIVDTAGGTDPTWAFRKLAVGSDPTPAPSVSELIDNGLEDPFEDRTNLVVGVVLVAVGVVLAAARRRRDALRPLVFLVTGLAGMAAIASVFLYGWDTYVPRRTGAYRVVLEATLLLPVFLGAAASVGVAMVGERGRARRLLTAAVLALALVGGFLSSYGLRQEAHGWRPAEEDFASLESLDIPADAVVLANAYTEGYLGQVTGATVLLEGRAPYTFADQLDRSIRLLQDAKAFYADPADNLDYLDRHDVDYVLASEPDSFSVTSANTFDDAVGAEGLRQVPELEEVLSSPGLVVFRYEPR
jgi:hypothetical protein